MGKESDKVTSPTHLLAVCKWEVCAFPLAHFDYVGNSLLLQ